MRRFDNSTYDAGKKNVFEVAARVDNCMYVYDTVCYAIDEAPLGNDQFAIELNAMQFEFWDGTAIGKRMPEYNRILACFLVSLGIQYFHDRGSPD